MDYDIFIIGGGINGAAIAADAAGRGLRVALCEQGDFAGATSSASSKLIHGGLRYLEQYKFKLVKESLQERAILMKRAPHLVYPLQFIMPDNNACRAPWIIRIGLFLYDYLANCNLPSSKRIALNNLPSASVLKKVNKGFSYYDCWGNDARLVMANLQLAQSHGAAIFPRTRFIKSECLTNGWKITLQNNKVIRSKMIINAAGPWADHVAAAINFNEKPATQLRLVKGSHIIVKRFYDGDNAFILQHTDGRIIFIIPLDNHFSMIGTTDIPFQGDSANVTIDSQEIEYLFNIVNYYFHISLNKASIISTFSGVRPLYNDCKHEPSKVSRDFKLLLDESHPNAPYLSVYGGKLTTHRALAEKVMQKIDSYFPNMGAAWTATNVLPGGDMVNVSDYTQYLIKIYPALPVTLCARYAATYGTKTLLLLKNIKLISELGQHFGADLYEIEVRYLIENEWALTAEDILWRRTKTGLYFNVEQTNTLNNWIKINFLLGSVDNSPS